MGEEGLKSNIWSEPSSTSIFLCVGDAKALARLHACTVSSKPLSSSDGVNTSDGGTNY